MAATAVLLIAAAVAVVLVHHHGPAGPSAQTSHRPHASISKSAGPSSTPTPQPTATGLVTVDPSAAGGPREAAVVAVLERYFGAINNHAYGAYQELFSPTVRGGLSAAAFSAGYGSTRDSAATLHSISVLGPGQLAAVVTFTSHQQAAASPTQSSCTSWRITLYLIKQGHKYLLTAPPPGYVASYHSCS